MGLDWIQRLRPSRKRSRRVTPKARPGTARRSALLGLALVVLGIGIYLVGREQDSTICAALKSSSAASVATRVSMVVYSDFQCPPCRVLDEQLRRLRGGPKVDVVHRQFPFDTACNPWVSRTRHPGACMQARAAICAARQGRYDDFSDRLFDRGSKGTEELIGLATSAGLDGALFSSCLASPESAGELADDIRTAHREQIRGTPTIVVAGVRRLGPLRPREVECIDAGAAGDAPAAPSSEPAMSRSAIGMDPGAN